MVLEAIGAFALACNILQVVECGAKIATKAGSLHHSDKGDPSDIDDLEKITQQLNKLNKDLGDSIASDPPSTRPLASRLSECNAESLRLSRNFTDFLAKLRPKKSNSLSHPSWTASFRSAIRRKWHQDELVAMERNLSQAKSNLIMAFLLHTFTKSEDAAMIASSCSERSILAAISETSGQLRSEIFDLTQHVGRMKVDESTPEALFSSFQESHADAISRLSVKIETILLEQETISIAHDERRREKAQSRICKSLSFESMSSRTDQIREAEDGTYDWILVDQNAGGTGMGGFQEWLNSPAPVQNIFWIFGKPGAGKSTLMHSLELDLNKSSRKSTLMRYLEPKSDKSFCSRWLAGQNLFVCEFFLWNLGHTLQKSIHGLLRSILHQCFSAHLWSIEIVISDQKWSMAKSIDPRESGIEWSLTELKQAVETCLNRLCMSRKVLLLIDGLDELDGTDEEREELLELLQRLSHFENLKLCASSRPWNIFGDFFYNFPKLQIQDYTRSDIDKFVRKKLSFNICQQSKYLRSGGEVEGLVKAITDKASGVFLWVRLVVQELLRGFRDGETIRTLREKVDSMPPDLDGFFKRMIISIESPYRREGSAFLQTALFGLRNTSEGCPHSLLEFTFLEYKDPEFIAKPGYDFTELSFNDLDAFEFRIDLGKRRINSRCMGLLESVEGSIGMEDSVDHQRTYQLLSTNVSFLHRSLMEFLLKADSQTLLQELTNGPFQARTFLCSALLAKIIAIVERISTGNGYDDSRAFWTNVLSSTMHNLLKLLTLSEEVSPVVMKLIMAKIKPASSILLDPLINRRMLRTADFTVGLLRFKDSDDLPVRIATKYGIVHYVKEYLTENRVGEGYLLDLLDQALNPSRVIFDGPHPSLISLLLEAGANLNASGMKKPSVWAGYMARLRISPVALSSTEAEVIEMMVRHGAHTLGIEANPQDADFPPEMRKQYTLRQCLEDMKLGAADRDRLESVIRIAEQDQAVTLPALRDWDQEETRQLPNGKRKQESITLESKRQKY